MDVGGESDSRRTLARLVREEAHAVDPEPLGELLQLAARAPKPMIDDREIVEVAKVRRRADQLVEVLGVADVARVHDHEAAVEPGVARPLVLLRLRRDRASVSTQFGITLTRSGGAPFPQPLAHRLPDRHDAVRPPEVEADERRSSPTTSGFVEPPELVRDLGEDVLG